MYLDISSNQGKIDWQAVSKNEQIKGVILRATTQNGRLDVRTIENYNGILKYMPEIDEISVYKFSYAKDYIAARMECVETIKELSSRGVHYDFLYLDIEKHSGADYTTKEADALITGYMDALRFMNMDYKLRLYFNFNYLKNIINDYWHSMPIWLARYNNMMGDTGKANIVLWQYTSTGHIDGIKTDVDLSREVIK